MSGIVYTRAGLAPTGSTGNNTHTSYQLSPAGRSICAEFVVEAVGATPTVTFKLQGTLDDTNTVDASANWFDLPFITDTADTVAATLTKTAVGSFPLWLSLANIRFVRRVRVVTSANTNVTYRCNFLQHYTN